MPDCPSCYSETRFDDLALRLKIECKKCPYAFDTLPTADPMFNYAERCPNCESNDLHRSSEPAFDNFCVNCGYEYKIPKAEG